MHDDGDVTNPDLVRELVAQCIDHLQDGSENAVNELCGWHREYELIQALLGLGEFLVQTGEMREAEELLREALAAGSAALGDKHQLTPRSRLQLGIALAKTEREREAVPMLERFLSLASTNRGHRDQRGGFARVLRATGGGHVVADRGLAAPVSEPGTVLVDDFDRDGRQDLMVKHGPYLLQRGNGSFANVTGTHLPQVLSFPANVPDSAVAGDVDGDGAPDVVGAPRVVWINDGTGRFTETSGRLPPNSSETGVSLGDADGDGDLDLASVGFSLWGGCEVLWNDGTGRFTQSTYLSYGSGRRVAQGDLDNDGDLDLALQHVGGGVLTYLNDGQGSYTYRWSYAGAHAVHELVDLDGDGDLDVLGWLYGTSVNYGLGGVPTLIVNDGAGRMAPLTREGVEVEQVTVGGALADIDGDGNTDLISSYFVGANDGTGRFVGGSLLGGYYSAIDGRGRSAVGDLDGDGDLDVVGVLGVGPVEYLVAWNNGAGRFGLGMPFARAASLYLVEANSVAADLDGDGDLDLVVDGQSTVLLNDGAGNFTAAPQAPAGRLGRLRLADVDGDGDIDILGGGHVAFPVGPVSMQLHLNDGQAGFTEVTFASLPASRTAAREEFAVADVDGDGDADLCLAGGASTDGVWINDGSGRFADESLARLPSRSSGGTSIVTADVDLDGDCDVVLQDPSALRLLRNDGRGFFSAAQMCADCPATVSGLLTAGDVDRDGDPDVLQIGGGHGRVLVNLHRQIHAPHAARPGSPYRIEHHSAPGYGVPAVAATLLSAGALPVRAPLPGIGELGIDPATAVVAGPVSIPAAGRADLVFSIPTSAALIGRVFFAQSVVAAPGLALTNVVEERIVP